MARFIGNIYSAALRMTTQLTVILPEASEDVTPEFFGEPKVLYLLHGLSGNSLEWARFSKIEYYAKKYNFIIIMPEVQRSFYMDGYYGAKYFTFVADELPEICKRWFNITPLREKTFIAGESMGGYGAVKIGLKRPEKFAGVGTLSGVLDFKRFIEGSLKGNIQGLFPFEVEALLGPNGLLPESEDTIELVRKTVKLEDRPRLIQICGTEDFLYEDNLKFREAAYSSGYGHTYMEWKGEHAWPFWDVAIQRVFQYFCGLDVKKSPIY